MKKKQRKTRMYVQLGKRYTNGKIAKAENYCLNTFFDECVFNGGLKNIYFPKCSWFDKFFKTKKYVDLQKNKARQHEQNLIRDCFNIGIVVLIEKDKYGGKKK